MPNSMPTEIENVSLEGEGTAAGVELPRENVFIGAKNRILQILARFLPGEASLRIWLHRWRGVKIGEDIQIGTDVIIETAYPQWVVIGNRVVIAARTLIMAHAHGLPPKKIEKDYVSVEIKDDVYIGPGALILANIKIGQGSVVTAGQCGYALRAASYDGPGKSCQADC